MVARLDGCRLSGADETDSVIPQGENIINWELWNMQIQKYSTVSGGIKR